MAKRRLGRGIDALLEGRGLVELEKLGTVTYIPLDEIVVNAAQPRKQFNETTLGELANSIREKGIIQPLLVQEQDDNRYMIIAGERRYRAAALAGLDTIPVLVRDFSDEERLEIALIENLQREDLNPIEEATAFQELLVRTGDTQEQLAKRLGINRSTMANTLRLLRLPREIQDYVRNGKLTEGHARALLAINDPRERLRISTRIQKDGLSVRAVERLTVVLNGDIPSEESNILPQSKNHLGSTLDPLKISRTKSVELRDIEARLLQRFGTKVEVRGDNQRGILHIHYYSLDDLERIIDIMRE